MNRSEAGKLGAKHTYELWVKKYLDNPNHCKQCNSQLTYDKKNNTFCNRSCAATFNNLQKEKKFINCKSCGAAFYKKGNHKFCNRECSSGYEMKMLFEKITETNCLIPTNDKVYGYNPITSKKYLIETRGHKCEICSNTEWMEKPIPLILDHIDGNPLDNRLCNVRLVCGNCNMQLPTFAGRNRGKGRKNRYNKTPS